MKKQLTKAELMDFWVKYAYDKRGVWDNDPTKPLRTETWCDYLHDNYWEIMRLQGLTRNDVFYGMRFPINRFKKNLK